MSLQEILGKFAAECGVLGIYSIPTLESKMDSGITIISPYMYVMTSLFQISGGGNHRGAPLCMKPCMH